MHTNQSIENIQISIQADDEHANNEIAIEKHVTISNSSHILQEGNNSSASMTSSATIDSTSKSDTSMSDSENRNEANTIISSVPLKMGMQEQMTSTEEVTTNEDSPLDTVATTRPAKRKTRPNPLLQDISPHILNPSGRNDNTDIPKRTLNHKVYFYNKGYRFVYPYYHNFVTHCKGRWIGKILPKVFTEEFKQYTVESVKEAMRVGNIKINSRITLWDTPLQNRDFIENKIHRHEMPVRDDPIEFIIMESTYFVVNKPASIPVHPCGHYRNGSLTHILEHEYGMKANSIFPVHRLDRLTSGVLLIARTKAMATALAARIADHGIVQKCYLARVLGKFPETPSVVRFDGDLAEPDKRNRGKWCVVENGKGKPCRTLFTLIKYNEETNESIVMCRPVTGRTHQIRVHLMAMSYPISNDPNYGPEDRRREFRDRFEYFLNDAQREIFEAEKAKYEESLRESAKKRLCVGDDEVSRSSQPVQMNPPSAMDILLKYAHLDASDLYQEWQFQNKEHMDPNCLDCKLITLPRSESDNMIYLHSYGYEVSGIKVFSSIPHWANVTIKEAEEAWERLKHWEEDEPNYARMILEYSLKKSWKHGR